jgi:hypothetical protein
MNTPQNKKDKNGKILLKDNKQNEVMNTSLLIKINKKNKIILK